MPRPAPDPQTVQKALALLSEGVSLREAARRVRVSPSTVYAWKTDATKTPSSETKPETKPNATGKPNIPKQAPRHAQPNTADASPPFDVSALLAEKDERIALLTTELSRWQAQTERLTDALTEERRRTDVLQLQALERRALPSDDDRTTHTTVTSNRRERLIFAVAVAALVLLALALLFSR